MVSEPVQRESPTPRVRVPATTSRVVDLATNEVRQITFGQGTNESPSYSANGRHLAFSSTRGSGNKQIS